MSDLGLVFMNERIPGAVKDPRIRERHESVRLGARYLVADDVSVVGADEHHAAMDVEVRSSTESRGGGCRLNRHDFPGRINERIGGCGCKAGNGDGAESERDDELLHRMDGLR